jgi:hypothetical protein
MAIRTHTEVKTLFRDPGFLEKQIRDVDPQLHYKMMDMAPILGIMANASPRTVDNIKYETYRTEHMKQDMLVTAAARTTTTVANDTVVLTEQTAEDFNQLVVGNIVSTDHPVLGWTQGVVFDLSYGSLTGPVLGTISLKFFEADVTFLTTNNYGAAWTAEWDNDGGAIGAGTGSIVGDTLRLHIMGNVYAHGSDAPNGFYLVDEGLTNYCQFMRLAKEIDLHTIAQHHYAEPKKGVMRLKWEGLKQFNWMKEQTVLLQKQSYGGSLTQKNPITRGYLGDLANSGLSANFNYVDTQLDEFTFWDACEPMFQDYDPGSGSKIFGCSWSFILTVQKVFANQLVITNRVGADRNFRYKSIETPWGTFPMVWLKYLDNIRIGVTNPTDNSLGYSCFIIDPANTRQVVHAGMDTTFHDNLQGNGEAKIKFEYRFTGGQETIWPGKGGLITLDAAQQI